MRSRGAGPSWCAGPDRSEATEDVAAFRQLVADGPLSIVPECRGLAALGLAEAGIKADDQGSTYIQKRSGSPQPR